MPHSGSLTPEGFIKKIWCPFERYLEGMTGCEETHEDGVTPHLHTNVKLLHGISKANLLNRLRVVFPDDYKRIDLGPTRQHYSKADYLYKEDLNPFTWEHPNVKKRGPKGKKRRYMIQYCQHILTTFTWNYPWKFDMEKTMAKWDDLIEDDPDKVLGENGILGFDHLLWTHDQTGETLEHIVWNNEDGLFDAL